MKMNLALLAVAVLFTSGSVMAAPKKADAPKPAASKCDNEADYPIITKADLAKQVEAKSAFVVDVNSSESYKETHVPTAIHYADHKADFAKLLPANKDALVVAYCGGPQCQAWFSAAKEACKLGYTNVQHFKDGISGWKKM